MKMHEKHRGHESMHAEMILILFATLIFSQIALVKWKQVYPSSYHVSIVAQNIKFKAIVTILLYFLNGVKIYIITFFNRFAL